MRLRRHSDPLSRFILTLGVADMVIGGVGDRLSLLLLGMTTAGIGLMLRWARRRPQRSLLTEQPSRALPPSPAPSSRSASRRYRERRIY